MADKRAAAAPDTGAALPPITTARFHEAMLLMQELVDQQTTVFIERMQAYRDQHRAASGRPLSAIEVAQVAAGLGKELSDAQQAIDDADLKHYDEPESTEVLLAGGVATAPAFFEAAMRVFALLSLPPDVFKSARKAGTLRSALDDEVERLEDEDLALVRDRASAAFRHLAAASGVEPGKAWATIGRTVWSALMTAADQTSTPSSSLTGSPPDTAGTPTSSSTS